MSLKQQLKAAAFAASVCDVRDAAEKTAADAKEAYYEARHALAYATDKDAAYKDVADKHATYVAAVIDHEEADAAYKRAFATFYATLRNE